MSETDCTFTLHSDIAGIGVRIAVYMQALVVPFLNRSTVDKRLYLASEYWFATIIYLTAALVQARAQKMNILDGVVVFLVTTLPLIWNITGPMLAAEKKYPRYRFENDRYFSDDVAAQNTPLSLPEVRRKVKDFWCMLIGQAISRAIYLVMWAVWLLRFTSKDFISSGTTPGCAPNLELVIWDFRNGTSFETFRYNVRQIVIYIVMVFGGLFVSLDILRGWIAMVVQLHNPAVGSKPEHTKPIFGERFKQAEQGLYSQSWRVVVTGMHNGDRVTGWRRWKFLLILVILMPIRLATPFIPAIIIIILIEKTISINHVQRDFNWTYGQVAALAWGVRQTMRSLGAVLQYTWKRTSDKERGEKGIRVR